MRSVSSICDGGDVGSLQGEQGTPRCANQSLLVLVYTRQRFSLVVALTTILSLTLCFKLTFILSFPPILTLTFTLILTLNLNLILTLQWLRETDN